MTDTVAAPSAPQSYAGKSRAAMFALRKRLMADPIASRLVFNKPNRGSQFTVDYVEYAPRSLTFEITDGGTDFCVITRLNETHLSRRYWFHMSPANENCNIPALLRRDFYMLDFGQTLRDCYGFTEVELDELAYARFRSLSVRNTFGSMALCFTNPGVYGNAITDDVPTHVNVQYGYVGGSERIGLPALAFNLAGTAVEAAKSYMAYIAQFGRYVTEFATARISEAPDPQVCRDIT